VYFDTSSARIWSPCTERNDKAKQKKICMVPRAS
jgi:hypothetical protein